MNALRGSLCLSVLGVFVLATGCQGEDTSQLQTTDEASVNEEQRSLDHDESAADKSAIAAESDEPPQTGSATCLGQTDGFEPNNQQNRAVDAPIGVTNGLAICNGDEDWFRVAVPANTIVRVGIELDNAAGDLDLVVYDARGRLIGSRYGNEYPSSWRGFETNSEYFGLYSEDRDAEYLVRVVGHEGAENT